MTRPADGIPERRAGGGSPGRAGGHLPRAEPARALRVGLAWLAFIAIGIPGGAFGVAWPAIRDTWGLPTSWLGILLLALTGGYLSGAFVSGRVITAAGMGRAMFLSSGMAFLGLTGFGLAPEWRLLIAASFLLGVGQGILDASINLHFANHFSARMMNWLHASFSVGTTLGPFMMQLAGTGGEAWRSVWLGIALLQLFITLAIGLSRRRWTVSRQARDAPAKEESSAPMLATLRRPTVLTGMALFFVFVAIEAAAGSWSFTLFSETRQADGAQAAGWVGLYWGFFAIGRILYGCVADRIPFNAGVRTLILAVLLGALMFSLRDQVVISVAGLLLIGFAQAPVFPLLITATPQRMDAGHATNAIGFQISAAGLGIALLPALVGYLAAFASLEILGPSLAIAAFISLLLFNRIASRVKSLTP